MVRRIEPRLIKDWEQWLKHAESIEPGSWVALDLETTGLSPWKDCTAVIGLYDPASEVAGILHFPRTYAQRANRERSTIPQPLLDWLGAPERRYVSHNAVGFDAYFLEQDGVDVLGPEWYDTLTGEGVVMKAARRDLRKSLAVVYKRRLGMDLKEKIDHKTWQNMTLTDEQLRYVAGDIVYLPMLRDAQLAEINAKDGDPRQRAMALEQELVKMVMAMSINGFPIQTEQDLRHAADFLEAGVPTDYRQGFKYYIEERMASLRDQWQLSLQLLTGMEVNINSPKQVQEALARVGIEVQSTAIDTLTQVRDAAEPGSAKHTAVTSVMMLRTAGQRAKMYGMDEDTGLTWFDRFVCEHPKGYNVVHPRYWQVGTDTGRFSCSDPNMQQVGKDCRSFFCEIPGSLCLTADYSQLEVVITAWLAEDKAFLDAVLSGDVHTAMARTIFHVPDSVPDGDFKTDPELVKKRRLSKAGVFTFLFGGGYERLHHTAVVQGADITLEEARQFQARFFGALPGLQRKKDMANWIARNRKSHTVILPHGLIRHLAGSDLKPTTIMNTEVQGGAASGLKFALILMLRLGLARFVHGTVHDEIITIAPAEWYDTDPANLYAEPTWIPANNGGFVIKGELNRYVHWAMKQGMLQAFPGEQFGMAFPVKVGLSLEKRWHSDEDPHTAASIAKKAKSAIVIPGNPSAEERAAALAST